MFYKQVFLKILQNSLKAPVSSHLISKETPTQVFYLRLKMKHDTKVAKACLKVEAFKFWKLKFLTSPIKAPSEAFSQEFL